tara:strand:- start:1281 stop:3383 length:2103 start_codon:yes stop_codon:yes gene_type:complete
MIAMTTSREKFLTIEQQRPVTGSHDVEWNREQWLEFADGLLADAQNWASPNNARITPPGAEGGYGHDVDGLEGFARTFLLAGFRLVGARGEGLDELADFYIRGITAGVDPEGIDRWVRLEEHAQAKVEAASIALILDMTRPWIWDRLDELTQQRVIDYFAPVVGDDTYPQTNWVWFRLVVQTFLRSVGGPWSPDDVAADLARHDSFVREDGWMSDGDERSYDHYVGWALHLYPVLWARMQGAEELAAGRTATDIARLDRFLQDAIALVGADGSPLIQGRSLIYRFAAAAPFWVGIFAEVPSFTAGQLRHAANRIVQHFANNGVPDAAGRLTLGWHHEWPALAQSYSGPGSPYWAVKGLLGIALPAEHPVWESPAVPLPSEDSGALRIVRPAGWVVSTTSGDGLVRVINHGTDHAVEGTLVGDSPLYTQLGYSSATSPLLDAEAWLQPVEQAVTLVDASGRASHRASMTLLDVRLQDDARGQLGIASSTSSAHWMSPLESAHRHGSGLEGAVEFAGTVTVHSLVRGAWEVRLSAVEGLAPDTQAENLTLRVGGWAVSGSTPSGSQHSEALQSATVELDTLTSRITDVSGDARAGLTTRNDASPLGDSSVIPTLDYPVVVGRWTVALVELSGRASANSDSLTSTHAVPSVTLSDDNTVTVTWPDSVTTTSTIKNSGIASSAVREHQEGPMTGLDEIAKEHQE